MSLSVAQKIRYGFVTAFVTLLLGGLLTLYSTTRWRHASEWVQHSNDVIEQLDSLRAHLNEVESSGRGFVLSGHDEFIREFDDASRRAQAATRTLRHLTADNPLQARHLDELEGLVSERIALSQEHIDARRTRGLAAAAPLVMSEHAKDVRERLHRVLDDMNHDEDVLFAARSGADRDAARLITAVEAAVVVSALSLVTLALLLLNQLISRPVVQLTDGVERLAAGDLSVRVDLRSGDELGRLATAFNRMAAARQQTESALAQTKALLETLFLASPIAIVATDTAGKVDVWNPAAESVFGYARADVLGRPLPVVPKEQADDYAELRHRVVAEREVVRTERRRQRKDGALFDARLSVAPRIQEGRVLGMMALIEDITDEKRAAEALRQSEARLNLAQQIAHLGCWELDLVANKLTWSDEVYRIFGLAPQEFGATYEAFLNSVHPDDRAAVDAAYTTSLREGRDSYEIEHRVVRRSTGESRAVHETCEHFRDETGRIIRSVGTVHDITERKRIEDERQVFVSLLENSPDFIGITDPAGKPIYVNPAGRTMVGLPADYPIGETQIPDYYPADQRAFAADVIVKSMIEHGRWSGETYFRHWRTDEAIPVSDEQFTIRDPKTGRILGLGIVTRDISAARKLAHERDELLEREREARLELVETSEKLRVSESRLRSTLDHMLEGCMLIGCDWTYLYVNPVAARHGQQEVGALIGHTMLEIYPGIEKTDVFARYRRCMNERVADQFESSYAFRNGTARWYRFSVEPVPEGLFVLSLDITESREAERALRESEASFRALIELAPEAVYIANLDARFIDVNTGACQLLGYTREELVGKTIVDIIPPEDVPRLIEARKYLTAPEKVQVAEWTQLRKDGTPVLVEVSSKVLPDGRWVAFVRDIRERKRAEEALRESEERFRLAIDEAPIGMTLVSLDGRFVRVNRALCEIVGYSPEQLTQLTFQAITHPDDLATDLELLGKLTRGDISSYQLDKRYIRKDGSVVNIMLSASVLRGHDGAPLYYIAQIEDITSRKRAEEALRKSEEEFRSLAESMPQMVWVTTPDGLNTYFNQQWVDYTGLTLEESYGEGWIKPFHPDDRQRAWDAWQRATKHRDTYSLECRLRRADGTYQWWLIRGVPVIDPDGAITKWFGTCTDIEHIKVAEQKLKESEAKFSGIISISEDAIISIDEDQRIVLFNRGAEKIFGYSSAEVLGRSHDVLLPERFRGAHRGDVSRFATGGVQSRRMGERSTQIFGRCKNGDEFPAEASISRLEVGGRRLLNVVLRDVSEAQKAATEQQFLADAGAVLTSSLEYRETLARLAKLAVRDIADLCIIYTPDEKGTLQTIAVVHTDPARAATSERLGRLSVERQQLYFLSSVLESTRGRLWREVTPEFLKEVARSPEWLEVYLELAPGSVMGAPLIAHGKLQGAILFMSTRPRRYASRDLMLMEEVASRVGLAVENACLYQDALRATRARDDVLAIVAHDLRNPLSSIELATTVVQRQLTDTGTQRGMKSVEAIHRSILRTRRLINDLMDVTRVEAGQLSVKHERVAALQLVDDAVEAQQLLASSGSIELRMDVEQNLPDVWGDRDRILQVMENLIGNAVRFTPPGGSITVGATPRDGDVLFRVADTGSGVPADHLPHLFERFWRAKRDERSGAGLGLPICKGIVEAHGGRIWAESTVGRGTTFYFTVPVFTGPFDLPDATPSAGPTTNGVSVQHGA